MTTTPTDNPYGLDEILSSLPPYSEDSLTPQEILTLWPELQAAKQALQTKIEAMVAQGRQNLAGEIYSASIEGEDWKQIVLAELNSERSK